MRIVPSPNSRPLAKVYAPRAESRWHAYLLGYQFDPGPTHIMASPSKVHGGMPGSKVDLSSRIDFPQHAGGGMLRYLRHLEGQ